MSEYFIPDLIEGLYRRDWIALSKAVSIVENDYEGKEELMNYAYKTSKETCLVLGITGSGGAGKSTLIDCIIEYYVNQGKTVGVLAVDPSSSYTGGAVLGDRIRMARHEMSSDLYIRSFGSRGSLGGISQGAKDVLYLYKSFGFDIIIVESYGVGQAETDIKNFVDTTAVVMVPGNGDYIQLAKAGTQEIADIFVINKADNNEAEALYLSLLATFSILPKESRPTVVKTIARDKKGTDELAELLLESAEKLLPNRSTRKRVRVMNEISTGAMQIFTPVLENKVENIIDDVLSGKLTPYQAAHIIGEKMTFAD